MHFTTFGEKFTAASGILQLMDDLGNAMAGSGDLIMLGGGNPSYIPAVQRCLRERMQQVLADGNAFERLIGDYAPPQGHPAFRTAVADLLNRTYGWSLTERNIALTNGSQTAFFYLFNLFGGQRRDGRFGKILLPLAPEYIGYTDAGIDDGIFTARKPHFQFLDAHTFKYRVDFDALEIDADVSAICVSRPTNPTGNVLTDNEVTKLHRLAAKHQIPLILDNAYGAPFPGMIFNDVTPVWDESIVLCLSLSKLGLPGVRTGIIVAHEDIAAAIGGMNAVVSLAPGSLGAGLALDLVRSDEIIRLSHELIRPYYQQRVATAVELVWENLTGTDFFIHKPEGAFFLWLWFRDLPISSAELYERLKQRGVLVVPGHYFYPGLETPWRHKQECIRMNYTAEEPKLREGIRIIGQEVKRAYLEG